MKSENSSSSPEVITPPFTEFREAETYEIACGVQTLMLLMWHDMQPLQTSSSGTAFHVTLPSSNCKWTFVFLWYITWDFCASMQPHWQQGLSLEEALQPSLCMMNDSEDWTEWQRLLIWCKCLWFNCSVKSVRKWRRVNKNEELKPTENEFLLVNSNQVIF